MGACVQGDVYKRQTKDCRADDENEKYIILHDSCNLLEVEKVVGFMIVLASLKTNKYTVFHFTDFFF